jgi:hypothetical protein
MHRRFRANGKENRVYLNFDTEACLWYAKRPIPLRNRALQLLKTWLNSLKGIITLYSYILRSLGHWAALLKEKQGFLYGSQEQTRFSGQLFLACVPALPSPSSLHTTPLPFSFNASCNLQQQQANEIYDLECVCPFL